MACQQSAPLSPANELRAPRLDTLYDYQLYNKKAQPLSLNHAMAALSNLDVIMVGELHGHQGIHRFQADLFSQLLKQAPSWALAMEQFSRDNQEVVDDYLAGKLGETAFINQSNAWPSYKSDYRALLSLAKAAHSKVIAANAPASIVRCIGRHGPAYLDKLPSVERGWIAKQLTLKNDPYKAQFMANRHHGQVPSEQQFAAQTSWDDTMAESIERFLTRYPQQKVLLTVGRFHIKEGLGTVQRLLARQPNLKVGIIYPLVEGEPTPSSARRDKRVREWTLKVQALPPARINDEPLAPISLGEPDCPYAKSPSN
ncbi:hypothetical protein CBP12_13305 [Oceanisphaera avium]|uniref:Haem-binding uptake Tiki superfamily ChaN domain-containing protein n=2 Tax=Oceanisphaera avium TaxID=1903694 RepID=A0A1Y0D0T7_9GAMM|nr:hypothetical protein CBP12_13305 [Oceanisphaera avium]